MSFSADYLQYVLEQLAALGEVSSRRMFGGVGLYCDELFFGLIAADTLYLRVDDSNRSDYSGRGMAQFRPYADRPILSMNYYEAPAEVLEDARQLAEWARRSVAVAASAAASQRVPQGRSHRGKPRGVRARATRPRS
jgi:DNA transformation protein and related proteins